MMRYVRLLAAIAVLTVILSACNVTINTNGPSGTSSSSSPSSSSSSSSSGQFGPEPQWGVRTKTSGCTVRGPLQDPACTPGDILPNATKDVICQSGYASSVRNVPTSVKRQVFEEYGIVSHSAGEYEVDHLVSLELGGSNDISNLWPEAASPTPGFHQKDRVENYLHNQVCSGAIPLKQAQIEIATNWLAVYHQMGGS